MISPWRFLINAKLLKIETPLKLIIAVVEIMFKEHWFRAGDYGKCPKCGSKEIDVD